MAVIKLKTFVANLTNVLALFDKLRFFRSTAGEGGPFSAITADTASSASITGSNSAPFNINGLTITLKVDGGSEQTVTFISPDPVGVDLAIGEINSQTTDLTASESGGAVVISSDTTGTGSIIEITGGSALTELGLTAQEVDGDDADVTLVAGTENYEYDDQNGDSTYWYKSQYVNSVSAAVSTLSDAVQGNISSVIPGASLITAKIDLAEVDGTPMEDVVISIYNVYSPGTLVVSDIGVLGKSVEVVTDTAGHAEVSLVQGSVVDVTIAGTEMTRRVTVPSSGTEFNLIASVAAADDIFQIQTPDIPAAVRRS